MRIEIGDREGEALCYGNLGTLFQSLGQYDNAEEYLLKALAINSGIGNIKGEALCYGNLGTLFQCIGQYDKAIEHFQGELEEVQLATEKKWHRVSET